MNVQTLAQHLVEQRVASDEPSEVVEEDLDDSPSGAITGSGVVRADDHIGEIPQGVVGWEWFGVEHVEAGAGERRLLAVGGDAQAGQQPVVLLPTHPHLLRHVVGRG